MPQWSGSSHPCWRQAITTRRSNQMMQLIEIGTEQTCIGTRLDTSLLDTLRQGMLLKYRRNITNSLIKYMRTTHGRDWFELIPLARDAKQNTKCKRRGITPSSHNLLEFIRYLETGREVVERSTKSTWWEWKDDSALVFWRWTPEF
eukprot:12450386-Ditylum_brightwellii.AAC.1